MPRRLPSPTPDPANASNENTLGEELRSVLGWSLSVGAALGALVAGILLTAGYGPGDFPIALTFVLLWGLMGVAGGLVVAGLRTLAG